MTPEMMEMIRKLYAAQQNKGQAPNYQLNTPSLSPNNMAQMNAGQKGVMSNTTTPKERLDPWSIGIAAGSTAAPVGASLLGKRGYPPGMGGAPSLGMTRGVEMPNAYAGRKQPGISALLAQYLARR